MKYRILTQINKFQRGNRPDLIAVAIEIGCSASVS